MTGGRLLLAAIRHGPTAWNDAGRAQGRRDVPLSPRGEAVVAGWRLPEPVRGWPCLVSPLARATETARRLGLEPTVEPRLVEMDWGAWEGLTLPEIHDRLGDRYDAFAALGLEARRPGGEAPADVVRRLASLLAELPGGAAAGAPGVLLVTHRGVLRALAAMATGWDMRGPDPARVGSACLFALGIAEGRLTLVSADLPLDDPEGWPLTEAGPEGS